ncbi:MAG: hypothetical protein IPN01_12660 [Deltaproteobacteria bacterium]|nr:hypothetical protein [Deltaproteobacteria bacterium]
MNVHGERALAFAHGQREVLALAAHLQRPRGAHVGELLLRQRRGGRGGLKLLRRGGAALTSGEQDEGQGDERGGEAHEGSEVVRPV